MLGRKGLKRLIQGGTTTVSPSRSAAIAIR
jgi:hypothetical protein